jgi:hypothetical protein
LRSAAACACIRAGISSLNNSKRRSDMRLTEFLFHAVQRGRDS